MPKTYSRVTIEATLYGGICNETLYHRSSYTLLVFRFFWLHYQGHLAASTYTGAITDRFANADSKAIAYCHIRSADRYTFEYAYKYGNGNKYTYEYADQNAERHRICE